MNQDEIYLAEICDAVIVTTEKLRQTVLEGGSAMAFLQESMRLVSLTSVFSQAASSIFEASLDHVQKAMEAAQSDLVKDLMKYLKEQDND